MNALPPKISDWPQEWRDQLEERAGMMEHHGGMPSFWVRRKAEECVREKFRQEKRNAPIVR